MVLFIYLFAANDCAVYIARNCCNFTKMFSDYRAEYYITVLVEVLVL